MDPMGIEQHPNSCYDFCVMYMENLETIPLRWHSVLWLCVGLSLFRVVGIVNYELKKTFLLMVLGMKSMYLEPKWPLLNDWSERAFFRRGCFAPKTPDTHRFRIIFIIYVSYLYYSIPNISFKEPSKGWLFFTLTYFGRLNMFPICFHV